MAAGLKCGESFERVPTPTRRAATPCQRTHQLTYHGHPVQQQFLGKLDSGRLVITNQRIAFIGAAKSTSIPFAKLLHIECYSDAVAVFLEGRENPDFYLVAQPRYAIFMINWFLNQATF